jgi:UDP-3-O-acyl-N-acetylglucosamine deacetylase
MRQLITNPEEIATVLASRDPEIKNPPLKFQDDRFSDLSGSGFWTIKQPITYKASSTFGRQPVEVTLTPYQEVRPPHIHVTKENGNKNQFTSTLENFRNGFCRCLALENETGERVDLIEHLTSLIGALRLKVDIHLKLTGTMPLSSKIIANSLRPILGGKIGPNFPSPLDCNGVYLNKIAESGLTPLTLDPSPVVGVNTPLMFRTKNGHIILQPPNGDNPQLILDQQYDYPHIPTIGRHRSRMIVTPELFAGLAISRAPTFPSWIRQTILERAERWGIPLPIGLSTESTNILRTDGSSNSQKSLDDKTGYNWEIFGHEMIDKLCLLYALEQSLNVKLVGTLITHRTRHYDELKFFIAILEACREQTIKLVEFPQTQTAAA